MQQLLKIRDLVLNNQIAAIASETSINTVWFMFLIDIKYVDHSSNNIDNCIQNVPESQLYLQCNYPEKLNDNKIGVVYQRSKKSVLYLQSIVYPLVDFETNCNKKHLILLGNNRFIEVLNCV